MAGCAGIDCGQGKSAREEANLWISSLKDLLSNNDGRSKFRDFLDENGLEDEAKTVCFWERCNDIVTEFNRLKKTGKSNQYDQNEKSKFTSQAREVIHSYVDGREINLDEGQMKLLKDSVESDDPGKIKASFQEAGESALLLLKDVHTFFADHLHQKYH